MSIIDGVLRSIVDLAGIEVIEEYVERHRHHAPPVAGRFAGPYSFHNGEIIMAVGDLSIGVPYKGVVTFTNAEGGPAVGPATGATYTLDNPANGTASITEDGQGYDVTLSALGPVNLVYTGTNSRGEPINVPPYPLNGVDSVAVAGVTGDPTPA